MRGHDWADPLKYIRLGQRDNWYLTVGGETRQWFEHYENEYWGVPPVPPAPNEPPIDGNGYLKQRYMLSGDFHLGTRFRAFTEFHSGFVNWRAGGPRPIVDKDKLDLNQAFLDVILPVDQRNTSSVTLRVGRQQLHYGTGRLVSVREVPNVRASFDGIRVIVNTHKWRIDAFAAKPVFTQAGYFDDRQDHQQTFWGAFGTGPVLSAPFNLDLSYFGLTRDVGVFNQGIGPETRHTVGARIWRGGIPFVLGEGWDYDVEYALQFGTFGPASTFFPPGFLSKGNIRAWTVSTQTGYTFQDVKLQPRMAVNTGITSGDKDPRDPTLQTFFTPYPNGRFFGAIQQNGPLNVQGFRPSVTIQLPRRASFTADSYFFWRQSTNDALYDVPGFPLRPGNFSRGRYIGTQPGVEFFWPITEHATVDLNWAYFATGQFLHDTPPDKNLRYTGLIFIYRF
jgi:alginate export protein